MGLSIFFEMVGLLVAFAYDVLRFFGCFVSPSVNKTNVSSLPQKRPGSWPSLIATK